MCKENTLCVRVCVLSSGLPLLPLYCQSELLLFDYTDTPTVESALCNSRHLQPDYAIRAKWSPGFHLCSLHLPLHLQPDVNRCLRHAASHSTTTIYGVSFTSANKTRLEPAAESDLLQGQWGIFFFSLLNPIGLNEAVLSFPLPHDRYRLSGTWTPRTPPANRCNMNANVSCSTPAAAATTAAHPDVTLVHRWQKATPGLTPRHFHRPQVMMHLSLPPFSATPPTTTKLVQLYSPSLRSVGPRCTPSAVSRRRCPVSAGSWWICGSTRPPSPHPSARSRAPVYLFAALPPLGPGTTLLIASRASCGDTRARAHSYYDTRARRRGLSKWADTSGCDCQIKARFADRREMTAEGAFDLLWKRTFIFFSSCSAWRAVLFFPVWLWISFFKSRSDAFSYPPIKLQIQFLKSNHKFCLFFFFLHMP